MQMSKIKILCFHPALAPYRLDFFNLLAERVDLEVVFVQENLFSQCFDRRNLLAQAKFRCRYLTTGFTICRRVVRLGIGRVLREVKPDVVLAYEASPVTLELCIRRRFAKWKLWTSMDDSPVQVARRAGLRRVLRDWVIRHCDGVVVPSKLAVNEYARCCSSADARTQYAEVPIIYDECRLRQNAREVFRLAADWRRANLKPNEHAAFFIGRLSPEKNLKWLLERAADPRWPRDLRLFIVGSGREEGELVAFAGTGCPEGRVQFLGRKDGLQLYVLMAAQDIFILPSISETFGAVVSESLHWGARCLVSENVGAKSLIDVKNGAIFTFGGRDEDFHDKLNFVLKEALTWDDVRPSKLPIDLRVCVARMVERMKDYA